VKVEHKKINMLLKVDMDDGANYIKKIMVDSSNPMRSSFPVDTKNNQTLN